jgi:hypothetical protein
VFDIWPDLKPGAQFGPIIQTVESSSLWRRISMNSLPFSYALKTLAEECFQINSRPGYHDPLIIYLRFRGKPRSQTFNQTAQAISANLEEYRLPNSFNRCRSQDTIFSIPMIDIMRKVIIASNVSAEGTYLRDYLNIGPAAGVKMDYTVNEARGLGLDSLPQLKEVIKHNLTWVAPFSEDANAENNSWDFKPSFDIGIMFCAMNFGNNNDKLKAYMVADWFGKQSFKLKPEPLRYKLIKLVTPGSPPDPGFTANPKGGTPNTPPELSRP